MTVLSPTLLGIGLATVASLGFALQNVFVRLGTQEGSIDEIVWVSLGCNAAILVPSAFLLSSGPVTLQAAGSFAAAGVFGALLARLFMFQSVERIGASRTAPIISANVLFAALLAVVFLGETITAMHLLGIVLIVVGVSYISYETAADSDEESTRDGSSTLVALPILAALFLSFEPIFISVGFSFGIATLPGLAINVTAALFGFTLYVAHASEFPDRELLFQPEFKWYVGVGLATTVGMLSYFAALEVTEVVLVTPIMQTSPLFVLVISAVALPRRLERVTVGLTIAALVVVVGATLVSVYG